MRSKRLLGNCSVSQLIFVCTRCNEPGRHLKDKEYGTDAWFFPDANFGSKWKNVIADGLWPESVYPYVVRYYGYDGQLMSALTLKKINEQLKVPLKRIPNDVDYQQ